MISAPFQHFCSYIIFLQTLVSLPVSPSSLASQFFDIGLALDFGDQVLYALILESLHFASCRSFSLVHDWYFYHVVDLSPLCSLESTGFQCVCGSIAHGCLRAFHAAGTTSFTSPSRFLCTLAVFIFHRHSWLLIPYLGCYHQVVLARIHYLQTPSSPTSQAVQWLQFPLPGIMFTRLPIARDFHTYHSVSLLLGRTSLKLQPHLFVHHHWITYFSLPKLLKGCHMVWPTTFTLVFHESGHHHFTFVDLAR